MDTIRRALVGATTPTFMALAAVTTSTALSLRPAFIPLVLTLSILINYARTTVGRPEFTHRFFALLATLSVATLAAYSGSTRSALSTRFLSATLLVPVAAVFSAVALLPILVYARTRAYVGSRSTFSGLLLFPAFWATTWSLFVYISPLGRIGTWTPMAGIEDYFWVTPVFGQAGIDYITALWAVIVAEYTGEWLMGSRARDQLPEHTDPNVDFLGTVDHEAAEDTEISHQANGAASADPPHRYSPAPWLLGLLLLAILPSYWTPILPAPTHSANTTELIVACVHPYVHSPGTPLDFDDYLAETKTQASRAKIVLWPEGAVHFRSDKERAQAFVNVSEVANHQKAWIAVAYEQSFSNSSETVFGKRVRGHNSLTIFGPDMEPLTYIKRRLVPRKYSHLTQVICNLIPVCSCGIVQPRKLS